MKKRVFYVYRTARKQNLINVSNSTEPNHILYGFNYIQKAGYTVSFSDVAYSKFNLLFWVFLPIQKLFIKLTSVGFKLDQALLLLPYFYGSDVIITTTDSVGLPVLLLKKIRVLNKPVIYISTGLINELSDKDNKVVAFYKSLLPYVDIIICHSYIEKKIYLKYFPFLKDKIKVVPFGVDTNFFKGKASKNKNYILSVGRDKSRDYTLISKLAEQMTNENFVIVTSRSNINGINFPKNVKILIDQSYLQVKKLYQESKLIFLPLKEINRASGQIAFLESLASGKKIAVSNIAGIKEVYPHLLNKNVFLFKPRDVNEAKVAIISSLGKKVSKEVKVNDSSDYSMHLLNFVKKLEKSKICYFGSFDPLYSRNSIFINSLRLNGYNVKLCNDPLRPLKNYILLLKKFIKEHRDSDIIFVGFLGHYDLPIAWLLAKIFRKRLVFDAFISLYDTYILDRQVSNPKSLRAIKYYLWDFLSTHLADIVLLDTESHANYFKDKFKLKSEKVKTVYVGADDGFFKPIIKKKNAKFTVCFYGSFQPLQGVDFIIEAAAFINDKNIQLRITGDGQTKEEMVRLSKKLKLKNIKFLPRTSIEGIRKEIGKSDICLGIFGSSEKAGNVIPNKCYQAIAMGKPVVTMDSPAIREIFKDGKNILLIPNNNPTSLAEAIIKLKNDGELYDRLSTNAYNLFKRKLTPSKLSLDMQKILCEFL